MADFADAFAAFLKDGPTDSDGENNRSDHILFFLYIKAPFRGNTHSNIVHYGSEQKKGGEGKKSEKRKLYIYLFIYLT